MHHHLAAVGFQVSIDGALVKLSLKVNVIYFFFAGLTEKVVESRKGENQATLFNINITLVSVYLTKGWAVTRQNIQK